MPREPLFPHVPKKKGPLFPHVTGGQKTESQFIKIGDRVRYIRELGRSRRGDWPEGAWLEYGVEGTITEYHPGQPAVTVRGKYFEGIEPWAVVTWDNGGTTAIDAAEEGEHWERIGSISLLALTEGDPISKYCCRLCGECAPEELLEEGRFLDRISWLRQHYKEKHPGVWGKGQLLPMTEGEPAPPEYRHLASWVSEPLPRDAH